MEFTESSELVYQSGMKYRNVKPFYYKLHFHYGAEYEYLHPESYYALKKDSHGSWWIVVYAGCCWDGATKYPDYKWMKYPSLIHDVLHWLIKRGAIEERCNDLIDRELQHMILNTRVKIPWWQGGEITKRLRAALIRRATGLANEKAAQGTDTPVHRIVI